MTVKLGVIMDPIADIKVYKDTSYALLLEAQKRGWEIFYMEQGDLIIRDGEVYADTKDLTLHDDESHWFDFGDESHIKLSDLDVVMMRKDPPFDMEYIYTTYLLDLVEAQNTLVVNKPQSIRDANEKLFSSWFPQCCPTTLVTRRIEKLREFAKEHDDIVVKPLGGMGGENIFVLRKGDLNASVVFENMTHLETVLVMAQKYIPEIKSGDKRIIMIDGEPVPHALARVPLPGESRGNLAAGAKGKAVELTDRDRWICEQVGPTLKAKGLLFVGLDVIGDYLTEINVTSPTCIRELDTQCGLNISAMILDSIAGKLPKT